MKDLREQIIETLQKHIFADGDIWIIYDLKKMYDDLLPKLDAIPALPLYPKEFVEWVIFECDLLKESQHAQESQEEMIERLYTNWKNLPK